ncbi:MAG TPA: non-homologous end-joining DNA ligase, partial [Nitrospira sp.]|nr:non-homologous end-joining DNA ligase [Nitrospira sp.]
EVAIPSGVHFCEPNLVCEVRYSELTDEGSLRHPAFLRLLKDAVPADCKWEPLAEREGRTGRGEMETTAMPANLREEPDRSFKVSNPGKVFWPNEGYTKGDLIEYYRSIAPWMLPYLKDRPVMITRYPDGIEGESFYQKDAPGFVPKWIRTEKIYAEDSQREISHFILDSPEALAYVANLGTIPIHIWSSRISHLERPDWLLFDIDPKGSTTAMAAQVAREVMLLLRKIGLRPVVKTSGQAGFHVVVGLKPVYTYQQARDFSELVSHVIVARFPELATTARAKDSRQGRVYIDYLQLGHGKTIAAPFSVRPMPGAPVSVPIELKALRPEIDVFAYNIKTVPARMERLGRDPFLGAITDPQSLEDALPALERDLKDSQLLA